MVKIRKHGAAIARGKGRDMSEFDKIVIEIEQRLHITFVYYPEGKPTDVPYCDKQFDRVTDDGAYTFFRFSYRNVGYIGVLTGVGETERNYAEMLPSYIESFAEAGTDMSKTEYLRRILLGESSSMGIYKYKAKYSLQNIACFAVVMRISKWLDESIAILEQYSGSTLDTVVKMDDTHCVFVKFCEEEEDEAELAEFLAQSLKEELGIDIAAGVGPLVSDLKDIATSYQGGENALRYADVFNVQGKVHSYREFLLVKLLEEIPESTLRSYFAEFSGGGIKEILDDEEMLNTAEAFLQNSLNVSETSRQLYMHRNTLLYRLDKIEKATGLNVRQFSDAVSFRVLTVLYKLLEK